MAKIEPLGEVLQRGGGRRARRGRAATQLSEINVVPLIDVMLVLLVIFMVTAPMMTQGFPVQLPQSRRSQPIDAQPLTVSVPRTFPTDRQVRLGEEAVPIDLLGERVRQQLEIRTQKGVMLALDDSITAGQIFVVLDELRAGGVTNVGVQSQPPRGRDVP